jgi:hypothetical protein
MMPYTYDVTFFFLGTFQKFNNASQIADPPSKTVTSYVDDPLASLVANFLEFQMGVGFFDVASDQLSAQPRCHSNSEKKTSHSIG